MEITVLYFMTLFPMYPSGFFFATLTANRFASLSDEELQGKHWLKIMTAQKHTQKKPQANTYTYKNIY
jgi:hypothetical protein